MNAPARGPLRWLSPLLLGALVLWAWNGLDLGPGRFQRAGRATRTFFQEFWPPDFSAWNEILFGLQETLQIAVLATIIGLLLSLPLALLCTSTLSPPWLAVPARLVASTIRVPPSLLWAIIMVAVFGLGPLAGVAAMAFYSSGYLAKLQYEAMEGLPRDAMEAVRAMGAGRMQAALHVVLPEAQNALRSQALFMLEYNVRASTIIGVVGAGGIGQQLGLRLQFGQYAHISAILIVVLAVVMAIDGVSLLVRRRFLEHVEAPRARWRDLFAFRAGRTA